MNKYIEAIYEAILEGELDSAREAVQSALDAGSEPGFILAEGMISSMKEVGRRYEEGDYFVPEMLIAARAMQAGMALLKPHLVSSNVKSAARVNIGTVKGDMHDIGKNLVALMMEGAGFEVQDLGVDVPADKFIEAIQSGQVDVLALSALLTTTMPNMQATIQAVAQAGLREKVKIIIGGAPVTQEYANLIGADGYAADASRAVSLVESLVGAKT